MENNFNFFLFLPFARNEKYKNFLYNDFSFVIKVKAFSYYSAFPIPKALSLSHLIINIAIHSWDKHQHFRDY